MSDDPAPKISGAKQTIDIAAATDKRSCEAVAVREKKRKHEMQARRKENDSEPSEPDDDGVEFDIDDSGNADAASDGNSSNNNNNNTSGTNGAAVPSVNAVGVSGSTSNNNTSDTNVPAVPPVPAVGVSASNNNNNNNSAPSYADAARGAITAADAANSAPPQKAVGHTVMKQAIPAFISGNADLATLINQQTVFEIVDRSTNVAQLVDKILKNNNMIVELPCEHAYQDVESAVARLGVPSQIARIAHTLVLFAQPTMSTLVVANFTTVKTRVAKVVHLAGHITRQDTAPPLAAAAAAPSAASSADAAPAAAVAAAAAPAFDFVDDTSPTEDFMLQTIKANRQFLDARHGAHATVVSRGIASRTITDTLAGGSISSPEIAAQLGVAAMPLQLLLTKPHAASKATMRLARTHGGSFVRNELRLAVCCEVQKMGYWAQIMANGDIFVVRPGRPLADSDIRALMGITHGGAVGVVKSVYTDVPLPKRRNINDANKAPKPTTESAATIVFQPVTKEGFEKIVVDVEKIVTALINKEAPIGDSSNNNSEKKDAEAPAAVAAAAAADTAPTATAATAVKAATSTAADTTNNSINVKMTRKGTAIVVELPKTRASLIKSGVRIGKFYNLLVEKSQL